VIVPVHTDGWAHFRQSAGDLRASFDTLGFGSRLKILEPGVATVIEPICGVTGDRLKPLGPHSVREPSPARFVVARAGPDASAEQDYRKEQQEIRRKAAPKRSRRGRSASSSS
jgi:hypothetical protein